MLYDDHYSESEGFGDLTPNTDHVGGLAVIKKEDGRVYAFTPDGDCGVINRYLLKSNKAIDQKLF